MTRISALAAIISLSSLAAACSGGGSEPAKTEDAATAEAPAATAEPAAPAAPAPAADAGPPAADDVTTLDGVDYASLTGVATAGKIVFAQCRTCHVTDEGVNKIGPSLHNIVGRTSGQIAGFQYSDANKNSNIVWSEAKLFQYLEKPTRIVPGTKMVFGGIADAQKRADLIAYLKNPS